MVNRRIIINFLVASCLLFALSVSAHAGTYWDVNSTSGTARVPFNFTSTLSILNPTRTFTYSIENNNFLSPTSRNSLKISSDFLGGSPVPSWVDEYGFWHLGTFPSPFSSNINNLSVTTGPIVQAYGDMLFGDYLYFGATSSAGTEVLQIAKGVIGSFNSKRYIFSANQLNVDASANDHKNGGGAFIMLAPDDNNQGTDRGNIWLVGYSSDTAAGGGVLFKTRSSANTLTDRAFMNYQGRWGIGHTSPTELFDIRGTGTTYSFSVSTSTSGSPVALAVTNSGNVTASGTMTASTFSGSGGSLTSIPAGQLTGSISDARLSANVALLSAAQTFTTTNTFTNEIVVNGNTGHDILDLENPGNRSWFWRVTGNDMFVYSNFAGSGGPIIYLKSNASNGNVGFGTSSPSTTIDVNGPSSMGGHVEYYGTTPTVSSCGTTPSGSVAGNDNTGNISVGGGAVTACTLTFASSWTNIPACVISDTNLITSDVSAASVSAVTFSFSASIGSGKIYYQCAGYK